MKVSQSAIQQDSLGLGLPWCLCGQRMQKKSTECWQNAVDLGTRLTEYAKIIMNSEILQFTNNLFIQEQLKL